MAVYSPPHLKSALKQKKSTRFSKETLFYFSKTMLDRNLKIIIPIHINDAREIMKKPSVYKLGISTCELVA